MSDTISTGVTRKQFIKKSISCLAAVACSSAVGAKSTSLLTKLAPTIAAQRDPDPIFAAISAHLRAIETLNDCVSNSSRLEQILPKQKRRSRITALDEIIVDTDAPQWIASEKSVLAASDKMDETAIQLIDSKPATVAGVQALLRYYAEQEEELFPAEVNFEDGSTQTFVSCLLHSVADVLAGFPQTIPVGCQINDFGL